MKNNSNLEFRKIKSLNYLYEINENGTIIRNVKSKKQLKIILDHHHSQKGYYSTFIHVGGRREGNYTKRLQTHTLVAECWLGDRPEGYVIDHIDRDTTNNHYSNLRYCTVSENMKNRVLSDRIIEQCKKNCREYTMKYVARPTIIKKDDEQIQFSSIKACAEWLANYYNCSYEHIRHKLKQKRSHIYDFDIIYLNAETRHADSTE